MNKPLGMTATLSAVTPSRAADAIWSAVEDAIAAGWTPERFKQEDAEAWSHFLMENAKYAKRVLT